MSDQVFVCNLALSHLRVSKRISNIDELTPEAKACKLFYDVTLAELTRDYPWPDCTKVAALALVSSNPSSEWQYAYRMPVDCMMPRRILSGMRDDNRESRVPYRIYADASGDLIYTDAQNAELEYSFLVTNMDRKRPDFIMGFSYRLAHYIANLVTSGDPNKLGDASYQKSVVWLRKAIANQVNGQGPDYRQTSDLQRARD